MSTSKHSYKKGEQKNSYKEKENSLYSSVDFGFQRNVAYAMFTGIIYALKLTILALKLKKKWN